MPEHKNALDLSTIERALHSCVQQMEQADVYFGHGTDNAWDESVHLVLCTLQLPLDSSPDIMTRSIDSQAQQAILDNLDLRINQRLPLPYITGEAWFCRQPFWVSREVLIPRSPIAELIETEFQPWLRKTPLRILDLCCGNGCIGIATALAFPDAQVVLADLSGAALDLARRNVQRHNLADRVCVIQSDLFTQIEGCFDLVITNPPYVDAEDMQALPAEYRHEPVSALASGQDGLHHPKQILQQAAAYMETDAILVMEVGNSWPALEQAFPETAFCWLEFENGGHGVFVLDAAELPTL